MNPVRAGALQDPGSGPGAATASTDGPRAGPPFLATEWALAYFGSNRDRARARLEAFVQRRVPVEPQLLRGLTPVMIAHMAAATRGPSGAPGRIAGPAGAAEEERRPGRARPTHRQGPTLRRRAPRREGISLALALRERELAAELDREPELDLLVDHAVRGDVLDAPRAEPVADSLDELLRSRGAGRQPDRLGLLEPGLVDVGLVVDQVRGDAFARATSTSRFEFDEFREPITSRRSTSASRSFTAHCRFEVA